MKLSEELENWLDAKAEALDSGIDAPSTLLATLGRAGLFRIGVPTTHGGAGGTTSDAISSIAAVAERSQAAAFVLWAQRVFIEYLLQSQNTFLAELLLPGLLRGEIAGATGLSNAMKFLGGVEGLQAEVSPIQTGFRINGHVPWATNIVPGNFIVAVVADNKHTGRPGVFAIPHNAPGVARSEDLDLIGLRGTDTASLSFTDADLSREYVLHHDAQYYLRRVRPTFLGMQCGLSIGLARRSIAAACARRGAGLSVLDDDIASLQAEVESQNRALIEGVESGEFVEAPRRLFELRVGLVETASSAVHLELLARGGSGYVRTRHEGFARRWREAAFLPIVTPSIVQLRTELARSQSYEAA